MSFVGAKTKLNYLKRVSTKNGRGREVTTYEKVCSVKGSLSAVKHFGSGSKDKIIAKQVNTNYDYELLLNQRDIKCLNEKNVFEDPKTNYRYEIQQILIPNNNTAKTYVVQLLRLR